MIFISITILNYTHFWKLSLKFSNSKKKKKDKKGEGLQKKDKFEVWLTRTSYITVFTSFQFGQGCKRLEGVVWTTLKTKKYMKINFIETARGQIHTWNISVSESLRYSTTTALPRERVYETLWASEFTICLV